MTEINKESNHIQQRLQQVMLLMERIVLAGNITHTLEGIDSNKTDEYDSPLKHHIAELNIILNKLNSSDLAFIFEALPIDLRKRMWDIINDILHGKILLEVSVAVRETLIATLSHEKLHKIGQQLSISEIAHLAPNLPQSVIRDVFKSLSIEKREQLRTAMSYPQDSVGTLMDFNMVTIRKDATVESVLRFLRRMDDLPDYSDQLFVVDRDNLFQGTLTLKKLLANEPEVKISDLMSSDIFILNPDDNAKQVAQAFVRHSLVSAPVIDDDGKLLGRVPIKAVIKLINTLSARNVLNLAGLHEEEDIYSSIWKSAKNRWIWLFLNLCAVFFASRVIGNFEDSIEGFVALAALMPIVANIAGISGNQTSTNIIRSLSLGMINQGNMHRLLGKEFAVSLLNGVVWGGIAGGFAYLVYKSVPLSLVMFGAMFLNLILGALFGMLIPLTLQKLDRNPESCSGLLLTAITTSTGFFIFLGLANIFLIN